MESNPNEDIDAEDLSKFMEEQTIKESSMNLGQFVSEEVKEGDQCKYIIPQTSHLQACYSSLVSIMAIGDCRASQNHSHFVLFVNFVLSNFIPLFVQIKKRLKPKSQTNVEHQ